MVFAFSGWRLWVLSRGVAQVCRHLDGRAGDRFDAQLEQFWREVCRLQERQDDLDGRIAGIEPWVRHLAARVSREAGR